jgi:hypothetical protein
MDTLADPDISFDSSGRSNYATGWPERHSRKRAVNFRGRTLDGTTDAVLGSIREGRGRARYDSILGLSGGVDSSYMAWLAWKSGLRPLVVHLDNSWDSELAVANIEKILGVTGFDYVNHIVEWQEFKDVQRAYLRAGVVDIEVVTDQAIHALLYTTAVKHRISTILIASNPLTEITMPRTWVHDKLDTRNLRAIHASYGSLPIRSYPVLSKSRRNYIESRHGVSYARLLGLENHDLSTIESRLGESFGWRNYKWKHCESVFTRFYQGYILPLKFGIDKRKPHLTDLVMSGQISRDEAIERLGRPYYEPEELRLDLDFVLRKLSFSIEEFAAIMSSPPVAHSEFPIERRHAALALIDRAMCSFAHRILRPMFRAVGR